MRFSYTENQMRGWVVGFDVCLCSRECWEPCWISKSGPLEVSFTILHQIGFEGLKN